MTQFPSLGELSTLNAFLRLNKTAVHIYNASIILHSHPSIRAQEEALQSMVKTSSVVGSVLHELDRLLFNDIIIYGFDPSSGQ